MRPSFVATAIVALVALVTLASSARATPLGATVGAQLGFAPTKLIEQARTVCRNDPATNRRICWIDRSQPPTVCHWVRDQNGNLVRDCY